MNDKRNLLKAIGLTGAAGVFWKKPVVESVVLPVHAQSSLCGNCFSRPSPSSIQIPENSPALTVLSGLYRGNLDCGQGAETIPVDVVLAVSEQDATEAFGQIGCPGLVEFTQTNCVYSLWADIC